MPCADAPLPRPRTLLGPCFALLLLPLTLLAPAVAQPVIPKIESMCPLGYVDLFNGSCSTLGEASHALIRKGSEGCPAGWADVGGGYCRRK